MDNVIDRLVRPNVKNLAPYQSARGTVQGDLLFMDAAENPWSPFEGSELNRYPSPQPIELLTAFGNLYGAQAENIAVTRGSEEGIRLLLQTFTTPGKDKILTCPPTFAMYKTEAAVHDVEIVTVPRLGTSHDVLDVDGVVAKIDADAAIKLVFLCNPGNPSSTALPVAQVETLLERLRDKCIVVIDEAYIEFADHPSFVTRLGAYPNLVILRTLSKSYGLAGLRCGCIVASAQVIQYVKRIIAPYPVPRPVIEIALKALEKSALSRMQEKQVVLKHNREYMKSALAAFTCIEKIYPSQTNFLCVVVKDAEKCVQFFRERGISIRNRSAAIPGAVNIAVGTVDQNEKILAIFRELETSS